MKWLFLILAGLGLVLLTARRLRQAREITFCETTPDGRRRPAPRPAGAPFSPGPPAVPPRIILVSTPAAHIEAGQRLTCGCGTPGCQPEARQ
jgi:hypothetical protein